MKTQALLLSISLAVAGVSSAHAQFSRPAVVNGTVLGAVAGALIGGHNNDRWAQGAVIGAAAGAIIGSAVDQSAPRRTEYHPGFAPAPVYTVQQSCAQPAPQIEYVQQPARVVYVQRPQPSRVVYLETPVCAPAVVVTNPYHNNYRRHGGNVVYVAPGYLRR